jgi:hypothetical protein
LTWQRGLGFSAGAAHLADSAFAAASRLWDVNEHVRAHGAPAARSRAGSGRALFHPDVLAGVTKFEAGTTWTGVGGLMAMHLAVAICAVATFTRFLPLTGQPQHRGHLIYDLAAALAA